MPHINSLNLKSFPLPFQLFSIRNPITPNQYFLLYQEGTSCSTTPGLSFISSKSMLNFQIKIRTWGEFE
jgi:hypothetical protein